MWNNIKEPGRWLAVSAKLLDLRKMLDVDVTKDRPYSHEAADGLRMLLRDEAKLPKTLMDFERMLAAIWTEAREHKQKQACEEACARAQAQMNAATEAQLRAREVAGAKLKILREARARQQAADTKLVEQFVMVEEDENEAFVVVDERETTEEWDVVAADTVG